MQIKKHKIPQSFSMLLDDCQFFQDKCCIAVFGKLESPGFKKGKTLVYYKKFFLLKRTINKWEDRACGAKTRPMM